MNRHEEGLRGNRKGPQVEILGASVSERRGVPEVGVRGGTWFPHATEPKAREVAV